MYACAYNRICYHPQILISIDLGINFQQIRKPSVHDSRNVYLAIEIIIEYAT